MNLREPYAYQLSSSSVVRIVAVTINRIVVQELSSSYDDKTKARTFAYPIDSCRKILILPEDIDKKLDLMSHPVSIRSLNTGKSAVVTAIGRKYLDVCFEDCHTTSIRLYADICKQQTDVPQELIDMAKDLAKNPRSFLYLHIFP